MIAHRSCVHNLVSCKIKAWSKKKKNSGLNDRFGLFDIIIFDIIILYFYLIW